MKWYKKTEGGYFSFLLGTLAASLMKNILKGKGAVLAGEWATTAGQKF